MDRWAAANLLREVIVDRFGSVEAGVAAGLKLRHDGGSCFRSGHYQAEIDHLGIERSPAFVYEPEKFLQAPKEQVLWIERFDTLEQLRARVRAFARDFNEHRLLERHGYRPAKPAPPHRSRACNGMIVADKSTRCRRSGGGAPTGRAAGTHQRGSMVYDDRSREGFVPEGFAVPEGLSTPVFRLVALGPEHNVADHGAWSASIEHIRATPGFHGHGWPPAEGMTLEENLADLERHARDFAERAGFTYTVLAPDTDDVLGCVYIYPARDEGHDADVRSWVRASVPELDRELHAAVSRWLVDAWPFAVVKYADRA